MESHFAALCVPGSTAVTFLLVLLGLSDAPTPPRRLNAASGRGEEPADTMRQCALVSDAAEGCEETPILCGSGTLRREE
ncbi:hypothetical protein FQA47_005253 [Oryzias melastigma]|uniref:Uncharacterized protein n=1 Tax=Oryzias melastigma TaxID=30732 RepID=A0A834BW02_ORYME|nr:hypothetical protein FQA47_005253 [Oryzias melastigma]